MSQAKCDYNACYFMRKIQLIQLKKKAIRCGVWFRSLQRIDRVLFDLTIMVTNKVRSVQLFNSIFSLTNKLDNAMESKLSRAIRAIGVPLAQKISAAAQKLGNGSAKEWAFDLAFSAYLAVMRMNGSFAFKA